MTIIMKAIYNEVGYLVVGVWEENYSSLYV